MNLLNSMDLLNFIHPLFPTGSDMSVITVLLSSRICFILTWQTLILVFDFKTLFATLLVGTPGSQYERGYHLMLGSFCLLCHGHTVSRFVSSSISGISIHVLASGSCFWVCFGLLVLYSDLCLREEALGSTNDNE